ncbi:hypothetical protein [Phytoactinopolyspora halotolerans]|uniref:Glycoside hydrolase family 15 n=1 Tax=Phytoactinopolyspora halotolerans TaxID=1981512 RepID=A0A6L9SGH2_9ACTN|nr:hypothetical protein [Phytoactinopolyspora halotolerans]NEE03200.1 hypothetical protein [Phytoactinopolyspora halotolerans]
MRAVTEELGTRGTAWNPETRLYSDGVVVGDDGAPLIVPPHSDLRRLPGTGYLDPSSGTLPGAAVPTADDVDRAVARSAEADLPGRDTPYVHMARAALIDIEVLTFDNGAFVAAGSPYWRYVWPRDTGFVAAALAMCGRHGEARRQLEYVASVQEDDGGWEARYLPDGSGDVPDGRGRQLDGIGWTLWATWVWSRTGSGAPRRVPGGLARMVRAAVGAGVDALHPETSLPRASQDFWEMDIEEATLGSAAPLLLGLRCGRDMLAAGATGTTDDGPVGDARLAERADDAARRLAEAIRTTFGPHGYTRRSSGDGGRDASTAFLLPPFAPHADDVESAWRAALAATTVANGGVRPGEEWTDLSTAWTPQVSLHALTAASVGDAALAHRLLSWLDVRRTRLGSLPEKVTAAGLPAAVAPLGLTGATVLLALATLEGRPSLVPR